MSVCTRDSVITRLRLLQRGSLRLPIITTTATTSAISIVSPSGGNISSRFPSCRRGISTSLTSQSSSSESQSQTQPQTEMQPKQNQESSASTTKSTSTVTSTSKSKAPEVITSRTKKTMAELDEELRMKMAGTAGDGGDAGLELENGKPVSMKRGVRENMFRYI